MRKLVEKSQKELPSGFEMPKPKPKAPEKEEVFDMADDPFYDEVKNEYKTQLFLIIIIIIIYKIKGRRWFHWWWRWKYGRRTRRRRLILIISQIEGKWHLFKIFIFLNIYILLLCTV